MDRAVADAQQVAQLLEFAKDSSPLTREMLDPHSHFFDAEHDETMRLLRELGAEDDGAAREVEEKAA